jgi:hypothetical protein
MKGLISMKKIILISMILPFIVLYGCTKNGEDQVKKEKVTQEARTQFKEQTETALQSFRIDVIQLKDDIENLKVTERQNFTKILNEIEERILSLSEKYEQMDTLSGSKWYEQKNELESSSMHIKVGLDTLRSNLRFALHELENE